MVSIWIVHLPTGIIVTATEERSQHQNRQVAWERLLAALQLRSDTTAATGTNQARVASVAGPRGWTWCGWRDEVKAGSRRGSMRAALRGDLGRLVR